MRARVIDGRCREDGCQDRHVHHFECCWCDYRTADPRCWRGHTEHCQAREALGRRLEAIGAIGGSTV